MGSNVEFWDIKSNLNMRGFGYMSQKSEIAAKRKKKGFGCGVFSCLFLCVFLRGGVVKKIQYMRAQTFPTKPFHL
jgi:hypothetical protein